LEDFSCPGSDSILDLAKNQIFQLTPQDYHHHHHHLPLTTLRFQQHAPKHQFGGFGKVFIDLVRLQQSQQRSTTNSSTTSSSSAAEATTTTMNLSSFLPKNIHRPFPNDCIRPVVSIDSSPFYLLHYVGGWERFLAKSDLRRGYTEWKKRAFLEGDIVSTSSCFQRPFLWLPRFVDQVGLHRARYLLRPWTSVEDLENR
jgi:hypothetical protein